MTIKQYSTGEVIVVEQRKGYYPFHIHRNIPLLFSYNPNLHPVSAELKPDVVQWGKGIKRPTNE